MNSAIFTGTGVAMVTPLSNDGSIDFPQLEFLCDHLINNGIDFLVALGTTAETPTLSTREKKQILDVTKKANAGRVPLVVGAGGNNTMEVIQWIKDIGSDGIDAYLSVAPYYNKPSQEGMKQHFSAIAASADIPIMLYNVPGRTASNISAQTTLELVHELGDSFAGIKEASGDFSQIMNIIKDKPEGFKVLSGDDALTIPMIACGAEGIVSVIGNALPSLFSSMVNDALKGDYKDAKEKHYKILPILDLIFREGNPTGVKALMELLDLGKSNLRLPLIQASEALIDELNALIKTL